jgi:trehalose 2-sulfotransferase
VTRLPRTAYLVCATPRSGSTLLCEMLRGTGVAGAPREHFERLRHSDRPRQPREYFAGLDDPCVHGLLTPLEPGHPSEEPADAWRERVVREGMTPNGVWAGKLMWGHVEDLLSRARELDGLAGADLATVLRALFGDVRLVFVTRVDKVAQAVSLWRAVQTQRWSAPAGAPRELLHDAVYSFAAIDYLVAQLEAQDAAWRRWFVEHAVTTPFELSYEQIDADPRAAVQGAMRFAGLPAVEVADPPLRHQSDARSHAWAQRYVSERRDLAA